MSSKGKDKDTYNISATMKGQDAYMLRFLMEYYRIGSARQFIQFILNKEYNRLRKDDKERFSFIEDTIKQRISVEDREIPR